MTSADLNVNAVTILLLGSFAAFPMVLYALRRHAALIDDAVGRAAVRYWLYFLGLLLIARARRRRVNGDGSLALCRRQVLPDSDCTP